MVEATENGRRAWFVIRLRPDRHAAFLQMDEQSKHGQINLPDYGEILTSGWVDRGGQELGVSFALQTALPDLERELVLERAWQISNGETKSSDYLSPSVLEMYGRGSTFAVVRDVRDTVRAIADKADKRYPLSTTDELRLTTDVLLRRFYAPKSVLCRRTDEGALVLAVGFDQIGPVFNDLSADRLRGFVVEFLDDSF